MIHSQWIVIQIHIKISQNESNTCIIAIKVNCTYVVMYLQLTKSLFNKTC